MYGTTNIQATVEHLVRRYKKRLYRVDRMGDHTVLARLTDGSQVAATVIAGGAVAVWELEEGWL